VGVHPRPPEMKPSSSYSFLKFVYLTSQLHHSLVVHPLLRKILDPPLLCVAVPTPLTTINSHLKQLKEIFISACYFMINENLSVIVSIIHRLTAYWYSYNIG